MAVKTKTPPFYSPTPTSLVCLGPHPPINTPQASCCVRACVHPGLWCQLRLLWEQPSYYNTDNRSTIITLYSRARPAGGTHQTFGPWRHSFIIKTFICSSLSRACTFDDTVHACHNLKYLPFALVRSHCVQTPFCGLTISRLGYSESGSWIRCSWVKLGKDTPGLSGAVE